MSKKEILIEKLKKSADLKRTQERNERLEAEKNSVLGRVILAEKHISTHLQAKTSPSSRTQLISNQSSKSEQDVAKAKGLDTKHKRAEKHSNQVSQSSSSLQHDAAPPEAKSPLKHLIPLSGANLKFLSSISSLYSPRFLFNELVVFI